jgi:hypothetical protein
MSKAAWAQSTGRKLLEVLPLVEQGTGVVVIEHISKSSTKPPTG